MSCVSLDQVNRCLFAEARVMPIFQERCFVFHFHCVKGTCTIDPSLSGGGHLLHRWHDLPHTVVRLTSLGQISLRKRLIQVVLLRGGLFLLSVNFAISEHVGCLVSRRGVVVLIVQLELAVELVKLVEKHGCGPRRSLHLHYVAQVVV